MILWAYRTAANSDPGYMEENFIGSFSDIDEEEQSDHEPTED